VLDNGGEPAAFSIDLSDPDLIAFFSPRPVDARARARAHARPFFLSSRA
jgi:hypothetical protein